MCAILLLPGGSRSPGFPLGLQSSHPQGSAPFYCWAYYCWVAVGAPAPHEASWGTILADRGGCFIDAGWGVILPPHPTPDCLHCLTGRWVSPCFLWHHLVGFEASHYSLERREVSLGGGGAAAFSVMSAGVEQLFYISYLLWEAAPFLVLWLREQAFVETFSPASIGISGLPVTPAPSLGYMR